MRKRSLYLLIVFMMAGVVRANNNDPSSKRLITGKILDSKTGEALAGVKVQVKDSETICYTDLNGNYILPVPADPAKEIQIELVGYSPLTIKTSDTGLEKNLGLSPR